MENMGGHWRERVKGFVFSTDIMKRDDYSQWKEDNQFFPTPKAVAKRVAELSGVKEYAYKDRPSILEPSAGHGALLEQLDSFVKKTSSFYVVEPNEENADELNKLGYEVERMSFERFYNKHIHEKEHITHVVMNPPFSFSRDIKHTMMAYELLRPNGVLVSVVSENSLYYDNDNTKEFNDWLKEHNAYIEPIPYGAFKESGTTVDTVIIKVVKE